MGHQLCVSLSQNGFVRDGERLALWRLVRKAFGFGLLVRAKH